MNKKGSFGVLLFFMIIIAVLIVAGVGIAILIGVINIGTDTIIPELSNIGMVDGSNISEYAEYTTTPVNTLISSFTWMGGVAYGMAIFGLIGLAIAFRLTMSKIFIVVFFAFAVLLLFLSILISNIYQDIYSGTDELATELKDQVMLSWLILKSPLIFSVVIFISGIILFSGIIQEESFV
jgi:hypothetical protein